MKAIIIGVVAIAKSFAIITKDELLWTKELRKLVEIPKSVIKI